MADGIRERGRYYDIIVEALVDYDDWMLDDDYDATPVLNRIMKRMRERLEMSNPPQPDGWRQSGAAANDRRTIFHATQRPPSPDPAKQESSP